MPRITISEEDLTIANDFDIAANVVYVPGMTLKAPAEPKLYRTVKEFVKDFGDQPYKFSVDQTGLDGTGVYLAANDYERSYIYAVELLNIGLPVLFHNIIQIATADDENTENGSESRLNVANFYAELAKGDCYTKITDRWTYPVKFITSGGYDILSFVTTTEGVNTFDLANTLMTAAAVRADAIALLDCGMSNELITIYEELNRINPEADIYELDMSQAGPLNNIEYVVNANRVKESILKYGTVIAPGATYSLITEQLKDIPNREIDMVGSFGYLLSLANSITTLKNPDYLAVAGVNRGLVPHIKALVKETTGAEAEAVQVKDKDAISINPIVNVTNYGLCIWGNRTVFPNQVDGDLSASSFLNLRVLASDVKKNIYAACQQLTFETNNLELWLKFKTKVEPILEQMITNGSLEDYELRRLESDKKATLSVYVKLITLYAVEDFNITVGLTDSTVEEIE